MDVPLAAAVRAAAWLLLLLQLPGAEAFARKSMPQRLPGDVHAVQQVLAAAGVADARILQRFADEEMDMTALYWCPRQTLEQLGVTKKGQRIRLKVEIDDYLARESRQGVASGIMHYVHVQASSALSRVRQAPEVRHTRLALVVGLSNERTASLGARMRGSKNKTTPGEVDSIRYRETESNANDRLCAVYSTMSLSKQAKRCLRCRNGTQREVRTAT